MKRWRNLVPAAGLLLAVAVSVSVSAREWTDNTGTYKTEANLVEVRGNQVVLQKSNGQVISLPIDRLSKSDQEYLESLENLEPKPENAATAATETITNSIGMKLKLIPPGQFVMGSPASEERREEGEEQHQVRITRGFYMGQTEVTQHQWLTLCREHEQSRAWFLPVAEVERTAAAAGLGPPAKRLTSVALRYGLAAILAVALLFAVGLTAKALLFPRQLKGQHNG